MRLLLLILIVVLPSDVHSGCYQKRLCCVGRNNTCKDIDDGIDHIPNLAKIHSERDRTQHRKLLPKEYATPYYEAAGDGYDLVYPSVFDEEHHEKIGKMVLPDVIQVEGATGETLLKKYGYVMPRTLVFGKKYDQREPLIEVKKFLSGKPQAPQNLLIRYSVLSQYVPLLVGGADDVIHKPAAAPNKFYYLESGVTDCYCDESCISLGDCCSDYTFTCPPRDCEVSGWLPWTSCKADKGLCGLGTQQRIRTVARREEHGGIKCPPLKEMKTCFVDCKSGGGKKKKKKGEESSEDDVTTVALLLDYKYNSTRKMVGRNNIYWDIPNVAEKMKNATYYCVHYTISWVNRNCVSKLLSKGLTTGSTLCAECQPEAQLHRKNSRCASDLDDGDEGFWKLIGPKSCNGIWTRVNRTEDCHCSAKFPNDHPFLLV